MPLIEFIVALLAALAAAHASPAGVPAAAVPPARDLRFSSTRGGQPPFLERSRRPMRRASEAPR